MECLEQLRVRELYEVFPLENQLFANFPKQQPKRNSMRMYISATAPDSATDLQTKVQRLLQEKQKSFTRADKLRLVGLTALSCGGLSQEFFNDLLSDAGLIDNRYFQRYV